MEGQERDGMTGGLYDTDRGQKEAAVCCIAVVRGWIEDGAYPRFETDRIIGLGPTALKVGVAPVNHQKCTIIRQLEQSLH